MSRDWLNVFKVGFRKNKGRGGKPDSLLVEYYCHEFGEPVREWVCLEHGGYALNMAQKWWQMVAPNIQQPKKIDDAIAYLQESDAIMPCMVKIADSNGFTRVCDYRIDASKQPEIDGKKISRAEYKENIIQGRFD